MRNKAVGIALLAVLAGCGRQGQPEPNASPSAAARVAEEVLYYREDGQSEPHPNALRVIQAIADLGAPVRLSSKPDYSDAIGADGRRQ